MEIHVVAGVLYDQHGRLLIAQRPPGKVLAGRWEFPGGKVAHGEGAHDALVRELREELGLEVAGATRLMYYAFRYPDRTVWLDVWVVTQWHGMAEGLDGQALAWVAPINLPEHDILEADRPIVASIMANLRAA